MKDFIDRIRDDNIEWYGKCVLQDGGPEWGEIFTEKLYSKKTHFIYELLQNAEDACERKRNISGDEEFRIDFKLTNEGLEVKHNGILFDEDDIKGICYIGRGTKNRDGDVPQIGKFGIGFKSVYAYTSSPHVYSGNNAFWIENLVLPYWEEMREGFNGDETLFYIPFNHKKVTSKKAYKEIGEKLRNLGLRTLLFLRNVDEITWEIEETSGNYSRKCRYEEGFRWVTLYMDGEKKETWLVFEKQIPTDEGRRTIEIAYLVKKDEEKKTIVRAKDTKLVVYFPTEKETHLHFLVQGPYNTTATRDNIVGDDEWNEMLIEETGHIVADTITKIKSLGLLDINFFQTLPLNSEISSEDNIFHPIYEEVRKLISSTEEIFPTSEGTHVSSENALIGRGDELIELLSSEQLEILFKKKNWLDSRIKETGEFRNLWVYLTKVIGIMEIRPAHFAAKLNKEFLKLQSDDWIIRFYKFLTKQSSLWETDTYTLRAPNEGGTCDSLRVKPIIRLENREHVSPFDSNSKPNAFLPPSDDYIDKKIKGYFDNRVKNYVAKNEDARRFLKELGLREPDAILAVYEYILPRYRGSYNHEWKHGEEEEELEEVSLKTNLLDVKCIVKALKKFQSDPRNQKLLKDLHSTEFLYCHNMYDDRKYYCSSENKIYLGRKYTDNKEIETFLEGNDDAWLLDEIYEGLLDSETLRLFGCKDEIEISYEKPKWGNYVVIRNYRGDYARGVEGFDPRCQIDGVEWALQNITPEKSKIIWEILKGHYRQIAGIVEEATRQDYSNAKEVERYSSMGNLLVENKWIYDNINSSDPYSPSEIMLSGISNEYDKECPEAKFIAEKLGFKTPLKEDLKEKMSEEEWKWHELGESASKLGLREEIIQKKKKKMGSEAVKEVTETPSEIASELEDLLTTSVDDYIEDDPDGLEIPSGPTPDDEIEIQRVYGEEIANILKKMKLKTEVETRTESKPIGSLDMGQFLLAEYDGHCQICNIRLYSGHKKNKRRGLEFVTTRMIETRNKNPYTEMEWNVLCVCPNHFALFKYGAKELKGIWELANEVLNDEISAEWVEERGGSYYIANIKMMGKSGELENTELFYTPSHLRKIVALIEQAKE